MVGVRKLGLERHLGHQALSRRAQYIGDQGRDDGGVTILGGPSILGQPLYQFNHTWSHVVTRFNAQWQITPGSLFYFNRSEGFRSGGFSVRGTLSETVPTQSNYSPGSSLITFQPETNVTYEIGSKNRFFSNALVFNIDGFINDINNFQQTSVIETPGYGPGTNTYVVNLPKVEIKGIELDLAAKPGNWVPVFDGLTLSANAGFQKGRITNGGRQRQRVRPWGRRYGGRSWVDRGPDRYDAPAIA